MLGYQSRALGRDLQFFVGVILWGPLYASIEPKSSFQRDPWFQAWAAGSKLAAWSSGLAAYAGLGDRYAGRETRRAGGSGKCASEQTG